MSILRQLDGDIMSMSLMATIIGLLVDTVEIIRLGRGLRDYVARRASNSDEGVDIPEKPEQEGALSRDAGGA
ncbi:MAG: hypothetical protein QI197_04845 [Candidatus Korarchaeota archaeon]|nr:hypothetical protein [Candidatus Korarchaeota archaeon]